MVNELLIPPSIVVGIDGSKAAIHAALWAVDEAVSRDIPLRLLYAIEPDDARHANPTRAAYKLAIAENALRYALVAVEATDKSVKIEMEIAQERPVTALIRASASAAMVCIGAVGAHDFRSVRVGSTAAALAVSGHCPVAIIRDPGHRNKGLPGWIVVDTGGSGEKGALLGIAAEEARLRSSPLKVITCRQTSDGGSAGAVGNDDGLICVNSDDQRARWTRCYSELPVESVPVRGGLMDFLAENIGSVRLVVVSVRDVAVLHNADCSVLIVDRQQ